MEGRRLAMVERIICIYSNNSERAIEKVENWSNENNIEFNSIQVGDKVKKSHYNDYRKTLGVTVGGDGTFLEGVKEFTPHNIPMLAINTGTLAFLARVEPDNIGKALTSVLKGQSQIENRQRLYAETNSMKSTGINDVMIEPTPPEEPFDRKIVGIDTYVNDEYVGKYNGSGIIISTPTGSTGAALSSDGPIHHPTNNLSLQITPLNTHSIGVRPIVVSNEADIRLVPDGEVEIMVDGGRSNTIVQEDEEIYVTGANKRTNIVRTKFDDSFFTALSEKLGWSIRNKNGKNISQNKSPEEKDNYQKALDIALESTKAAGEYLEDISEIESIKYKSDPSDIVTNSDRYSNEIIKKSLMSELDYPVISEENWNSSIIENNDVFWVVDPIDGTGNFTHGNPNYSISVALIEDNEPVVGVVYQPETDKVYTAIKNRGAYLNGQSISVTNRADIEKCMFISGYDPQGEYLKRLYDDARGIRAIGSAALNLCYVATGAADGSWEYDTYPWDVAAGILILEESGGKITDKQGNRYSLNLDQDIEDDNPLISSNSNIHTKLLDYIK